MEENLKVSQRRWDATRDCHKRDKRGKKEIYIPPENKWMPVELSNVEISPAYGGLTVDNPWEGWCEKKPWNYEVTAVIPCLNTYETLSICIELLRLQTVRPYIMLIDTGSIDSIYKKIEKLRAEDVEVHSIRLNGCRHPSDYPAMAMDLAFSVCRTKYLFATHADVFVRRRDLLEWLLSQCDAEHPAVGYEISPRAHDDWHGMISHTASMYHMPKMDEIGFGWSLRRLCHGFDIVNYKPDPLKPNWPDTEILGNYILRKNNIEPVLIGKENNQERTLDENIDHFRSYTSGKMYSPPYYKQVREWYEDATKQALERIDSWKDEAKTNNDEKHNCSAAWKNSLSLATLFSKKPGA
jgi:hypothetical protein